MAGLWTPPEKVTLLGFAKYKSQERIVTLPSGERVRVWIDDSGTVKQIEHDHSLDAMVYPKVARLKISPKVGGS